VYTIIYKYLYLLSTEIILSSSVPPSLEELRAVRQQIRDKGPGEGLVLGSMCNATAFPGIGSGRVYRTRRMSEIGEGRKLLRNCGVTGDYAGVGFCISEYRRRASENNSVKAQLGNTLPIEYGVLF
jgi:hypothetical protein